MKIGSSADNPSAPAAATPATTPNTRPAADIAATTPQAAEASAQVALSSTAAKLLSGAEAAAGEFDTEKVARISRAIDQGEFTINAEAIADKLIANAAEVLNNSAPKT